MQFARKLLSVVFGACLFSAFATLSAFGDLIISGFHGIRCYDETTGSFLRKIENVGEEQDGIAFGSDGTLYSIINDLGSGSIVRFAPESFAYADRLSRDCGSMPLALKFGPDGNLYVGSINWRTGYTGRIFRIDARTGSVLDTFVKDGRGGLHAPIDMSFGADGNLYVADWLRENGVLRYDGRTGEFLDNFVPPGRGGLRTSTGLIFGPDGNLYVSNPSSNNVLSFDGRTGEFLREFVPSGAGGLDGPCGLTFGPDGNLYVCSGQTHAVLRYEGRTGAFMDAFVQPGSGGLDSGPLYVVFTPRTLKLSISNTSDGPVISWPRAMTNCVVEASIHLNGPWQDLTGVTNSSRIDLLERESQCQAQHRFFRVRTTK